MSSNDCWSQNTVIRLYSGDELPKPVIDILRRHLEEIDKAGEIDVTSLRGPFVDKSGRYYRIDILTPWMREYWVYEDGRVVDKGCDYRGKAG
jgi:hypothetical protein